jgi:hypothetical protein
MQPWKVIGDSELTDLIEILEINSEEEKSQNTEEMHFGLAEAEKSLEMEEEGKREILKSENLVSGFEHSVVISRFTPGTHAKQLDNGSVKTLKKFDSEEKGIRQICDDYEQNWKKSKQAKIVHPTKNEKVKGNFEMLKNVEMELNCQKTLEDSFDFENRGFKSQLSSIKASQQQGYTYSGLEESRRTQLFEQVNFFDSLIESEKGSPKANMMSPSPRMTSKGMSPLNKTMKSESRSIINYQNFNNLEPSYVNLTLSEVEARIKFEMDEFRGQKSDAMDFGPCKWIFDCF